MYGYDPTYDIFTKIATLLGFILFTCIAMLVSFSKEINDYYNKDKKVDYDTWKTTPPKEEKHTYDCQDLLGKTVSISYMSNKVKTVKGKVIDADYCTVTLEYLSFIEDGEKFYDEELIDYNDIVRTIYVY